MSEETKLVKDVLDMGKREVVFVWDPTILTLDEYIATMVKVRDCSPNKRYKIEAWTYETRRSEESDVQNDKPRKIQFQETHQPTYQREEVYACIDRHLPQDKAAFAKKLFESRYGRTVWREEIPLSGVQGILINEFLKDLV